MAKSFNPNLSPDEVLKLIECPVCFEPTSSPIYQCQNGHLICNKCVHLVELCPECRAKMPDFLIRNLMVEKLTETITKSEPCPNSKYGCKTKGTLEDIEIHLTVCTYRCLIMNDIWPSERDTRHEDDLWERHKAEMLGRFAGGSKTALNYETGSQDRDRRRPFKTYPHTHQLFVGNLPDTATVNDMKEIFSEYGEVAEVKIQKTVQRNASEKVPYFCFVVFEEPSSVQVAMQRKGRIFMELGGGKVRRLNIEPKRSHLIARGQLDQPTPQFWSHRRARGQLDRPTPQFWSPPPPLPTPKVWTTEEWFRLVESEEDWN